MLEFDNSQNSSVEAPCESCDRGTEHKVLSQVKENGKIPGAEIYFRNIFQVIQCLGCKTICFRVLRTDSEDTDYHFDNETGGYDEVSNEKIDVFPYRLSGRSQIKKVYYLPSSIQNVYKETHNALCGELRLLSCLGMRVLLEAICKEQGSITGNLEKKIDYLVSAGLLTSKNADALHKVRFLGNDAAHEMLIPTSKSLDVVFDIIENLLEALYIIPRKVSGL
jgi:hypothetical protein